MFGGKLLEVQAELLAMETLEAFIHLMEEWPTERGARRVHCLFVAEEGDTVPVAKLLRSTVSWIQPLGS